jgi:hypothetical protein
MKYTCPYINNQYVNQKKTNLNLFFSLFLCNNFITAMRKDSFI